MKRKFNARRWFGFGLMCCSLFAGRLQAIDPLPPEIEAAPLSVQIAYRNKLALEGERQRWAAAVQRYEQKQAFQKALVENICADAAARRESFQQQFEPPTSFHVASGSSELC